MPFPESCMVDPAEGDAASTIEADVTVNDDPLGTVTDVTVALGPETQPGSVLCGTTTVSVTNHVAHFTDLGVDFGPVLPTCALTGCTYRLTATAVGATSGVSSEFTITLIAVPS